MRRIDAFLSGGGIFGAVYMLIGGAPIWLVAINLVGGIGFGISAMKEEG